jgi:hypothetical protein
MNRTIKLDVEHVNWMQLIAALAQALAWPVGAVMVAVIFREALRKILNRELRRLKAGPVELEWSEKIDEAQEQIKQEVAGDQAAIQTMPLRLRELAKLSPDDAVVASFREIESTLRGIVDGTDLGSKRPIIELVKNAVDSGVISQTTSEAIHQLRRLRNLAAHDHTDISYTEALEYIAIADAVMYALDARKPA